MHFVIHCIDKPNASQTRTRHFEAHKAYLSDSEIKVIISGPLVAEDNATAIGSCFLIQAEDLAQVKEFNRNDPYFKAGLWESVSIHPFLKRIDNRS